jgi:hypothetical protein
MRKNKKRQNNRMLSALKHGAWAGILPHEEQDWRQHFEAIYETLQPETLLEEKLAERIALTLWRLRRVANWEVSLIADARERAREVTALRLPLTRLVLGSSPVRRQAAALSLIRHCLTGARDVEEEDTSAHEGSDLIGVDEHVAEAQDRIELRRAEAAALERVLAALDDDLASLDDDAAAVAGAALIDALEPEQLAVLAERWGISLEEVEEIELTAADLPALLGFVGLERARTVLETARRKAQLDLMVLEQALEAYHQATEERQARARPDFEELGKLQRYEAHLERVLYRALHELEALQARRRGTAPPLARLEVYGIDEPPALGE